MEDQHVLIQEIAHKLGISTDSMYFILMVDLCMWSVVEMLASSVFIV